MACPLNKRDTIINKDFHTFTYQSTNCFTLQTSEYDVIIVFCVDSMSFKKCNIMITYDKGTCREICNVNWSTCNNAVNMRGNFSLYYKVDLNVWVLLNNSNLDDSESSQNKHMLGCIKGKCCHTL